MDAINQLFTELELAYHNQFHRAFAGPEQVSMAKQLWLHALADIHPTRIIAGGRRAISDSRYLPNIASLRRYCQPRPEELGLPDARAAYIEACRAPSPRTGHDWSHPAVYHAGRASDWHFLASSPEATAFPVFQRNYELLVERVMNGEELDPPLPPALPERTPRPLSRAEQQQYMAQLRRELEM